MRLFALFGRLFLASAIIFVVCLVGQLVSLLFGLNLLSDRQTRVSDVAFLLARTCDRCRLSGRRLVVSLLDDLSVHFV